MTPTRRLLASIAGAAAFSFSAAYAEPVRHVGVYVQPYYEAARQPGGTPRVAVGRSFDGLASNKREDILAIRDRIVADPKLVTPMTLMVLVIRFYDVGLRDAGNAAKFRADRARNGTDEKYCWKS